MNAIRMIKLFGWEPRLSKQLGAKREDELTWIKTSKLLELANNNLKYVYTSFNRSDRSRIAHY